MKHIRIEHKILASAVIFTACLVAGVASSGEDPGPQEIIFFESTIGEVIFPHEAHFDALEIEWDPSTVGALDDLAPGLDNTIVVDAIVGALAATVDTTTATLDDTTLDLARSLAPLHTP